MLGALFVLLAFFATIYLGIGGDEERPLDRTSSVLLILMSGVFQVLGVSQFHAVGKADPGLARASVRRLIKMTRRTNTARTVAEAAFDQSGAAELKRTMGQISVELSWLEEGLIEAVEDWNEFHGEALRGLSEGESDDRAN